MKWSDDWKGTDVEVKDLIEYYLNEIINDYKVDRKTAKKYLLEAFFTKHSCCRSKEYVRLSSNYIQRK